VDLAFSRRPIRFGRPLEFARGLLGRSLSIVLPLTPPVAAGLSRVAFAPRFEPACLGCRPPPLREDGTARSTRGAFPRQETHEHP